MDTLWAILLLMVICEVHQGFVDGLIGLRPPDQIPHKQQEKKPPKPVSPKPSRLHHTQLYSPYDNPDKVHNLTVTETQQHEVVERCQVVPMLMCSSQLLGPTLRNATNVCRDIKQFASCILETLKQNGRRDFVTAIVMLDGLQYETRKTFGCHGNYSSIAHLRHRISKRNGGSCCTQGVINCAIQTFFKMSSNIKESCNLVNYYDICMNEASKSCQSKSLTMSYPVFIAHMKRQCTSNVKRRKRTSLVKRVLSVLN